MAFSKSRLLQMSIGLADGPMVLHAHAMSNHMASYMQLSVTALMRGHRNLVVLHGGQFSTMREKGCRVGFASPVRWMVCGDPLAEATTRYDA